jgi:hypothetical protein
MQIKANKQPLLLLFVFFWILFVLGGYYYYHKPISVETILSPLKAVLDLTFSAVFVAIAGGLGRRLLPAYALQKIEGAVLQFALGSAIISFAWFGVGLLGLYRYPIVWPAMLLGLVLNWRQAREWYRAAIGPLFTGFRNSNRFERFLALLVGIFVIYQLIIALAPPIKWDALTYHLQLPRLYLSTGSLAFTPNNPYWGHPQLVEMYYVLAMAFHRVETAAVLGWTVGVLFLIGVFSFTNTHLLLMLKNQTGESMTSSTAGWMAVTALLAGFSFRHQFSWSYCDLFSALYGLAALIALFAWFDNPRRRNWFLWVGLMVGVAAGTKWTSGVLAIGLFSFVFLYRKSLNLHLKGWFFGGSIAFAATTPWLIKNWIVTGNPLYPYFFNTIWVDSVRSSLFNGPPTEIDWWMHLLAPITTTWAGIEGSFGFSADIGPLLLLFAVPGFWYFRHSPKVRLMSFLLIPGLLSLMFASTRIGYLQQTRLYYVLLICLAAPAGWGWYWLQQQNILGVRFRRLLGSLVILVMFLSLWQETYWMAENASFQVLMGTKNSVSYLEGTVGYHIVAMQAINDLPDDSKTLMLWEPRGLYAPANALPDLWIDRWVTDYRTYKNTNAILANWKEQGITHLLVYHLGEQFIRPEDGEPETEQWVFFQETMEQLPEAEKFSDVYTLYRFP